MKKFVFLLFCFLVFSSFSVEAQNKPNTTLNGCIKIIGGLTLTAASFAILNHIISRPIDKKWPFVLSVFASASFFHGILFGSALIDAGIRDLKS